MLQPQYASDFEIEIFLTLFYNLNAASSKEFHKEAIYGKQCDWNGYGGSELAEPTMTSNLTDWVHWSSVV